jgi:signal transduction histidine kinase
LQAVSRVTTAIAAGDLTQRAPVRSSNEIGQLAEDVNRMAAHLETAMGELRRARTQAEDALKARQELVASISHELRTPLAIVRAHLETLALRPAHAGVSGPLNGAVTVPEATLHALQNETERLAALVDDLFTLSRAETGALQVYSRPTDVAALVDDVASLMRPLAQSEGMIALSVEAPPGLPAALADGDRLRQILENLVRNAVRHTPDGGIIVLSVAQQDNWIVVSVADTGEGIPAEHLPHIFERFYRVDQARARSSGGAGLGLALVREFVELMGGKVSVESAVGEGSCFHVYLPVAAAATTLPLAGRA